MKLVQILILFIAIPSLIIIFIGEILEVEVVFTASKMLFAYALMYLSWHFIYAIASIITEEYRPQKSP